jgi:hypothetical protein
MSQALPHRYNIPSREDLRVKLEALINDQISRKDVSDWAEEYITYDDPQIYPEIEDETVWDTIVKLAGADLTTTDRPYLHDKIDFENWLDELIHAK